MSTYYENLYSPQMVELRINNNNNNLKNYMKKAQVTILTALLLLLLNDEYSNFKCNLSHRLCAQK